jgi:allophanate hydrolase subunit 2
MGALLKAGDVLERYAGKIYPAHSAIKARYLEVEPRIEGPIVVRTGPQWDDFSEASRCRFLESTWQVSPQSSRAGYRLDGPQIDVPAGQMLSEPMLLGSIQVPSNGQPIVILNDGPTVGGYPKIALITEESLDQFRQSSPGTKIQFSLTT